MLKGYIYTDYLLFPVIGLELRPGKRPMASFPAPHPSPGVPLSDTLGDNRITAAIAVMTVDFPHE